MRTIERVELAIQAVINGQATQYVCVGDKIIRVSNHGANPERVDCNTISIVIGNDGQSYRQDRGRMITNWERTNQWYMSADGYFDEQFLSVSEFLDWFDIEL